MVVNLDNWQIMQNHKESHVTIFKDGQKVRTMAAKKDLKTHELLKILTWYAR